MIFRYIALTLVLLLVGTDAGAQELAVNVHAQPGQPTKTVYVWGAVSTPGIWQVERDTGLFELLSIVQVPSIGGGDETETTLRLYRTLNGQRTEVLSGDLESLVFGGGQLPDLQEGDVVEVETRQRRRIGWQTIASVVGTLSSLAVLILNVVNLSGGS